MKSNHVDGGFKLSLDVAKWQAKSEQPWRFDIDSLAPARTTGTSIVVTSLYEEVSTRLNDGLFEGQLRDAISKTYAYFISRFVEIEVNGRAVEGLSIDIGENHTSQTFEIDGVTCSISAGIGTPLGGAFRDKSAGWFIFCNGRTVVSADKSALTGWSSILPIFQPKHRPFLGTVFFVSEDPERLPWTTTKSAINEDSTVWQFAKRHMVAVGRAVISFLDARYTDEGTEITSKDLQVAAGGARTSVLMTAVSGKRTFTAPPKPPQTTTKIQYDAQIDEVKLIAQHLGRSSMSGSDVGRYTFQYFLKNEVGEG